MQIRTSVITVSGMLGALFVSGTAEASEPETHDDFYLRMSIGGGPGSIDEEMETPAASSEAELSSTTTRIEFLFGGTPVPGLAIGAGLIGHTMSNPTLTVGDVELETDDTSVNVSQLALFINYFPDPHGGFNVLGSVGLGSTTVRVADVTADTDTSGAVFGFGLGYDFWVGDEWSIGPTLNIAYGVLSAEENSVTVTDTFFSPSLSLSFLYH